MNFCDMLKFDVRLSKEKQQSSRRMYSKTLRLRRISSSSKSKILLSFLFASLIFFDLILGTWQQIQQEQQQEVLINYKQDGEQPHHIVKRKSKGKLGRAFGFGSKKPKTTAPRPNPYPKQPAYNPSYPKQPAYNPSYPKQPAYNPSYPKQPAYNPNYMSGSGQPQAPPPYPGLNRGSYPQQSYPGGNTFGANQQRPGMFGGTFGQQQHNTFGTNRNPMGGGFGNSFGSLGRSKSSGIGRVGSAGFGALAGTALGAYGGYKLGKMVGGLGRHGHYGYYSDHGRYIRCDPPRNIKVDPETNISYIPLEDDYDKRCSYFDRPPPAYIEPSMLRSSFIITQKINLPMMIILFAITVIMQKIFIGHHHRTFGIF